MGCALFALSFLRAEVNLLAECKVEQVAGIKTHLFTLLYCVMAFYNWVCMGDLVLFRTGNSNPERCCMGNLSIILDHLWRATPCARGCSGVINRRFRAESRGFPTPFYVLKDNDEDQSIGTSARQTPMSRRRRLGLGDARMDAFAHTEGCVDVVSPAHSPIMSLSNKPCLLLRLTEGCSLLLPLIETRRMLKEDFEG